MDTAEEPPAVSDDEEFSEETPAPDSRTTPDPPDEPEP